VPPRPAGAGILGMLGPMADAAAPLPLDLGDFDAVGVMSTVVIGVRSHALLEGVDAVATVTAPDGWHRLQVAARSSGHVVLHVRYTPLSASRLHNVVLALEGRGWQPAEDAEGATRTFPPGTAPSEAAFEALAVLTVGGAPADVRHVTAVDGSGGPVALGSA
jgi:hypothetical protein